MSEIGSFLEFDFSPSSELQFHNKGSIDEKKLNIGRAGIYYALLQLNINEILIPYYMCPSVEKFLIKKGVKVKFYKLDEEMSPNLDGNNQTQAILIPNYFGLKSIIEMNSIIKRFTNVILDNSQSFYTNPIDGAYNIYSPRKFFGVPDGCLVYGKKKVDILFENDFSAITANFLFVRHELGCQNSYELRMENEKRLDNSDIKEMSKLSEKILLQIDYKNLGLKRLSNFLYVHSQIGNKNNLDVLKFFDSTCYPMVYPLVIENEAILNILKENSIFTGRWWSSVKKFEEVNESDIEYKLSNYMLPLPIDQRYNFDDLKKYCDIIQKYN